MQNDAFSRYHPIVNFIYFIGAIVCCVLFRHPAYLIASLFSAAVYYFLLYKNQKKTLWPLLLLFVIVAAVNPLFNTEGKTPLFHLFSRPYTLEALCYGLVTAAMLIGTILWFQCYNKVMTTDKFTSLFGNRSFSLLLVMILRLIPSLTQKAKQAANARSCIGKGVSENDSLRQKVSGGITVLSVVTDQALEGSIIASDSMRARGYGSAKRTSFRLYKMQCKDYILLIAEIILLSAALFGGHMDVRYIPEIAVQNVSWGFAAYCVFLIIPIFLQVKEAIQWRISISKI